jgi:hypothetical protein
MGAKFLSLLLLWVFKKPKYDLSWFTSTVPFPSMGHSFLYVANMHGKP